MTNNNAVELWQGSIEPSGDHIWKVDRKIAVQAIEEINKKLVRKIDPATYLDREDNFAVIGRALNDKDFPVYLVAADNFDEFREEKKELVARIEGAKTPEELTLLDEELKDDPDYQKFNSLSERLNGLKNLLTSRKIDRFTLNIARNYVKLAKIIYPETL